MEVEPQAVATEVVVTAAEALALAMAVGAMETAKKAAATAEPMVERVGTVAVAKVQQ